MAAALVGGSFLSAFLQVLFDRLASREFVDFFKAQKLSDELLGKLKTRIWVVNRLLDAAEEKQLTNTDVETWLHELKDAVYDADDLLDDIAYKGLRLELQAKSPTNTNKVRNFFSSRIPFNKRIKKMEAKIKKIHDRLKDLVDQKDVLLLDEHNGANTSLQKTPTTSLVNESGIYGRNDDKEAIVKLLLSSDATGESPGVIPIVGMGGVGKTTLAQLVYNDRRVQESFDLKAWVYVSEEFGVFRIIKDILKELGSKSCDTMTQNQLHLELKKRVMGTKYFLVLDDVWNEEYDGWEILLTPLTYGPQGSKIVVTTRNQTVASVVSTAPTHHLKELPDDDCWSLFEKIVFYDGSSSAHPHLEGIGREIVRKCKGLPLAIKSVAGLLRSKRDTEEWVKILKSNLWNSPSNSILPALRLSYHCLPSHLKRCFSYCAIFPKDHNFVKEDLIRLWMAEGFLMQPKGDKEMEEVGNEYFNDLVARSFFQQSSSHPSNFVMHDLICELAKLVSGEFCFILEDAGARMNTKRVRHLSYVRTKDDILGKFEGTYETQPLRTFLVVEQSSEIDQINNEALHVLLPTFKRLRVLSLSQCCSIDDLPDSIGNLKHLRYLNFFQASTKNLPKIVRTLYNLQTLILRECRDLVELPDSIGSLKHLRYLDLCGTSIKRLPDFVNGFYNLRTLILCHCKDLVEMPTSMGCLVNLRYLDIRETNMKEMPPHMEKLKNLRVLTKFINTGSRLKELGELHHLCGTLEIWNLQDVVDAQDALKANLKGKNYLKQLQLRWDGLIDKSARQRDVLEQLQPHRKVECISIVGYADITFPDWLGDSSFANIVSLKLSGCKYCSVLPPLGQLASLRSLTIEAFDGVMVLDTTFYGSCMKPFGSLEQLWLERLPLLHEWIQFEGSIFPLLRELHIKDCPNLTRALPSQLPSLTTLEIEGCQQLVASFPSTPSMLRMKLDDDSQNVLVMKLPSGLYSLRVGGFHSIPYLLEEMEQMGVLSTTLEEIEIRNSGSLWCFPLKLFSMLKGLRISECQNLDSLVVTEMDHGNFTPLSHLKISAYHNLVSFTKGGLLAPNLTYLRLWNCSNLKSLPKCMNSLLPSLAILQIVNCPRLGSFPEGGLPSKLESLQIRNCDKLIADRMQWDLQMLPCLSQFSFGGCEDMDSFPERTLLPSTLETLGISDLQNLVSLNYEGLQHLTSLTQLRISSCPNLQSIPKEGLPSSLSSLSISDCPLLEERCQSEKGEDWPKISHIPEIEIYLSIATELNQEIGH